MPKITASFPPAKRQKLDQSPDVENTPKIICRAHELSTINNFLTPLLKTKSPSGLYISGAPGTGKTLVVQKATNSLDCFKVFVNCMQIKNIKAIYEAIGNVLGNFSEEKIFFKQKRQKMILLILDEVDQLATPTLKTIFNLTSLPKSRLIAIGIANKLDLALESVQTINFPPYSREEIEEILVSRLSSVFEPSAIKFIAAKVAATTGDVRKAINACYLAMEGVKKGEVLKEEFTFTSPQKKPQTQISISSVAKIFLPPKDSGPLPLQQKTILATLLRVKKNSIMLNSFYPEYRKFCSANGLPWIEKSEMLGVCILLQDRGLMNVKENKSKGTLKGVNNCLLSFDEGVVKGAVGGFLMN